MKTGSHTVSQLSDGLPAAQTRHSTIMANEGVITPPVCLLYQAMHRSQCSLILKKFFGVGYTVIHELLVKVLVL